MRLTSTRPRLVLAVLPPARNDVVALGDLVQQFRDVGGIVLQVGVDGDDDIAREASMPAIMAADWP